MTFSYCNTPSSLDLALIEESTQILLNEYSKQNEHAQNLCVHVTFTPSGNTLKVSKKGKQCTITCHEPAHYFRCLNHLIHHLDEDFDFEETGFFEKNGFMLDCSRNAVSTIDTVKKLIRIMAKLGLNQLLLYTEDTYEVPGLPYFGTYRGRYSQEEIRQLDDYAYQFGIELVPCIQTLAHLRNALKWPMGQELKDSADILLVGSEKVYDFIRQLLTSVKNCFRSENIHIGMDEAVMLGLGNYLHQNGYKKSSELLLEHTDRVLEICRELNLKPMMWSDMFISSNADEWYYNIDENTDTTNWTKPADDLALVYWDYYNTDRSVYRKMLRVHHEIAKKTVFAGGIWNWNGIAPNYGRAINCTIPALLECQAQNVQEVFATGWMDNGAETPIDAIYPGLVAFATLCFHSDLDENVLKQNFTDCVDAKWEDFELLDRFDSLFQGDGNNISADNPSKYLLYQDAMLGMFDYHIQGVDTKSYYKDLADKLDKCVEENTCYKTLFNFYKYFALVLSEKADLGIHLKEAYDKKDLSTLEELNTKVIPNILENLQLMHQFREELWMKDAKPFGYELMDIKLGGVSARLKACQRRIASYLSKEVDKLEELEQERLPYWTVENKYPHDMKIELRENIWSRIVSGCDLVDTV